MIKIIRDYPFSLLFSSFEIVFSFCGAMQLDLPFVVLHGIVELSVELGSASKCACAVVYCCGADCPANGFDCAALRSQYLLNKVDIVKTGVSTS